MRIRRLLVRTLWLLGAVVALVVGLLWLGLSSEFAARKLIGLGLARAGPAVSIRQVTGRLRGPLLLTGIVVRKPAFTATIDSLLFEWTPSGLVHRQVRIDRLRIAGVHVTLPDSVPASPDTAKPTRPRLPLDVRFGDVTLSGLSVDAPNGVHLTGGSARLAGRAESYRLAARAVAFLPKLDSVDLALEARGNLERLDSARARAELLDGTVTVSGPVRWWPRIGWDLVVGADDLRPGGLMERPVDWPGSLTLRATTAGTLDSTGPAGHAALDSLGGTLRGQPLSGHLSLSFADSVYQLEALALGWGSARLTASGTIADTLSVRYRLGIANLATALRGAAGSITVKGTAGGPRAAALIHLQLEGRRLAYGANRVSAIVGRADVGMAADGRTDADLRADRILLGAQPVDSVTLRLRGTRARHNATASAGMPSVQVSLAADGGLEQKTWSGRVADIQVRGAGAGGAWRLERPVTLTASSASARLEPLCVRHEDERAARACVGGAWRGAAGWRATGLIERLPLALADSLLPRGRALGGTLDGRFDVSTLGGGLDGRISLAVNGGVMTYPEASGGRLQRIALDTAALEIRADKRGVDGAMAVRTSAGDRSSIGGMTARFSLPGYRRLGAPRQDQQVQAHLEGRVNDLTVARTFTRAVDSIGGQLGVGLDVTGTIGAPKADGSMQLRALRAWFPHGRGVAGGLDATLHAAVASDRRLRGGLAMHPRDLGLMYVKDSSISRFAVDGKGLELRVDSAGTDGEVDLGLRDTTNKRLASVVGTVRLPQYTSTRQSLRNQPVALRFNATVPDLAFARGFTTAVDTLAGQGNLELSAEGTAAAPRLGGRLRLEHLVARLSQGARLSGAVDGDLRAAVATDSSLTADVHLAPRDFAIEYDAAGTPRRMTVDSSGLRIVAGRNGVHAALDLHLDSGQTQLGQLTGRLSLPQYTKLGRPLPPQPLQATVVGRVDDLSIAQGFSAELDSVVGRASLDVDARGTVGKPQLTGGLRVLGVGANIPPLGLRIRELQLVAQGDQAGAVTVEGRMRSGRGWLTLRGKSPVRPTPAEPGRLRIEGDSVEAANTSQVRLLVSPRLDVVVAGDSVDVGGDLRIPYARIELSEIPPTAVPPTDDVVFTDTVANRAARQRVTARVRVLLGDSVSFKGFNFTADLGGDLLAVSVPGRPTTGSGTITIKDGHYKAYGQDLTISDGRLRFAGGPVDNPGLDIRATRTAEDSVTAGVKIAGTLKAPQVTIFSDPPMSQGRALQYLVLGHPLGQSGGSQGSLASQAASSLGLRGGNLLASTLGRGVGLDQARIETKGDLQQASFVAGKYLSPNLYVSYGIGLFDPVSTLRLRYLLSSKWTLQAETGEATGADLLFRIESGRGPSHQ